MQAEKKSESGEKVNSILSGDNRLGLEGQI
jgi:hypothetical protein